MKKVRKIEAKAVAHSAITPSFSKLKPKKNTVRQVVSASPSCDPTSCRKVLDAVMSKANWKRSKAGHYYRSLILGDYRLKMGSELCRLQQFDQETKLWHTLATRPYAEVGVHRSNIYFGQVAVPIK